MMSAVIGFAPSDRIANLRGVLAAIRDSFSNIEAARDVASKALERDDTANAIMTETAAALDGGEPPPSVQAADGVHADDELVRLGALLRVSNDLLRRAGREMGSGSRLKQAIKTHFLGDVAPRGTELIPGPPGDMVGHVQAVVGAWVLRTAKRWTDEYVDSDLAHASMKIILRNPSEDDDETATLDVAFEEKIETDGLEGARVEGVKAS